MIRSAGLAVVCLGLFAPLTRIADAQPSGAHHGAMMHMEIQSSIADGATLATRPDRMDLTFRPAMRLAAARLTNGAGERITVTFTSDAAPSAKATVRFSALDPDHYVFSYTADAGDHMMSGRIRFTVR